MVILPPGVIKLPPGVPMLPEDTDTTTKVLAGDSKTCKSCDYFD